MLESLFDPKSVAVIGASREEGKVGHDIVKNLVTYGYAGKIFPVNPKADEILGLKCFPSVTAIQDPVELAVVVIPAKFVLATVEELAARRVGACIIITAGFKETGPEGAKLEKALAEKVTASGMRTLGPNCLGLIDTHTNLNASFAHGMPKKGSIAFFSQSGALGTAILDWAIGEEIGFSKFISLGNKMDISETELLEALADDPDTSVILGYIESVKDGAAFLRAAERASRKKPVIITKSGSTAAGAKAASSHTGALAGSESAFKAAFKQSGIIRANSVQDLFDFALGFSSGRMPAGPNVVIVTNAGGPGIIAADAVERSAVRMAQLAKETVDRLREKLPPTAALYNPVDVVGDAKPDRYDAALQNTLSDPHVDAALVILTPQAVTEPVATAVVIKRAAATTQKPILASFVGGPRVAEGTKMLMMAGIPSYSFPERMVSTIEAMYNYKVWRDKPKSPPFDCTRQKGKVAELLAKARKSGRLELGESEARDVVTAYGFQVPKSILARTTVEAIVAGEEVGYPLVMKIASPDILHKSDIGGVKVGIQDPSETRRTFVAMMDNARRRMPEAEIWGVLVQQMVSGGKEVILGMNRDPQFGPMIMFGLGGIYVEALKDVSFRIAPLSPEDAEEMIREIHSYALLRGVRGEKPVNFDAIKESLLRLSLLVTDFPEILELDINPLKVFSNGQAAVAIDARLTVAQA